MFDKIKWSIWIRCRRNKIRRHLINLFGNEVKNLKFGDINLAKDFLYNNFCKNKIDSYMYLMTYLGDDFDRTRYITENNEWIKNSAGEYVVHQHFVEIASKTLI